MKLFLNLLFLMFTFSCVPVSFEEESSGPNFYSLNQPRLFYNDAAANDTSRNHIGIDGVKTSFQAGQSQLFVKGITGEPLLSISDINGQHITNINYSLIEDEYVFPFKPNLPLQVIMRIIGVDGQALKGIPSKIYLESKGLQTQAFALNVILVGKLQNWNEQNRSVLAAQLHKGITSIYQSMGVIVSSPLVFNVGNLSEYHTFLFDGREKAALPGPRPSNLGLCLYVVEFIGEKKMKEGDQKRFLGVSPRQAQDFNSNSSKVVVTNQVGDYSNGIDKMAITAAHEMGHFLGLRHTTSTNLDLKNDNDYSNIEDGIADTNPCRELNRMAKIASPIPIKGTKNPDENVWCIRTAASSCPGNPCETTNLMHPFECPEVKQNQLSKGQVEVVNANLSLLPH